MLSVVNYLVELEEGIKEGDRRAYFYLIMFYVVVALVTGIMSTAIKAVAAGLSYFF